MLVADVLALPPFYSHAPGVHINLGLHGAGLSVAKAR
jgi:hypothetical protein